jgi:hypothetical protein
MSSPSFMTAQPQQLEPQLLAELVLRVLHHCAGDVPTQCAAACIAHAWRAAAAEPRMWRDLRWGRAADRLTDALLAALVGTLRGRPDQHGAFSKRQ